MAPTSRTHGSFAALAAAALTAGLLLPGIACTPVEVHDDAPPGSTSSSGASSSSGSTSSSGASSSGSTSSSGASSSGSTTSSSGASSSGSTTSSSGASSSGSTSSSGGSSSGASSGAADGSNTKDIHTFLACLNTIDSTRVSDAVACLPSGCVHTLTTSTISAQPGCTLGDGTKLPRVDISCPGPGSGLKFRPSFTLCTKAGAIHHIEVAEDQKQLAGVAGADQKMGDIDSTAGFQNLKEFGPGAVVDTTSPSNAKGCGECHGSKGTVDVGGTLVTLYEDIPPDRGILFSNDPGQGPPLANQTQLSEICAGIEASSQLAANPAQQKLAVDLCNTLVLKLR